MLETTYNEILEQVELLKENHVKPTKAAASRARKATNELTALLKLYRKESLDAKTD